MMDADDRNGNISTHLESLLKKMNSKNFNLGKFALHKAGEYISLGMLSPFLSSGKKMEIKNFISVSDSIRAFKRISGLVRRIFEADIAGIYLSPIDDLIVKDSIKTRDKKSKVKADILELCRAVNTDDDSLFLSDIENTDNITLPESIAGSRSSLKSFAKIPLHTRDDQKIGALCVGHKNPYTWDKDDIKNLTDLSDMVMTELHCISKLAELENLKNLVQKIAGLTRLGGWEYNPEKNTVNLTIKSVDILGIKDQKNYAPGEILELLSERDRFKLIRAFRKLNVDGERFDVVLHIVTPGQKSVWLMVLGTCEIKKGEIVRIRGAVQDITLRMRSENQVAHYVSGLRTLNEIFSAADLSLDEQLHKALKHVVSFLDLSLGIISRIDGNKYHVEHAVSRDPRFNVKQDDIFRLGETYCDLTYEENKLIAIPDVESSIYARHPCYKKFHLNSYIGIPIIVDEEIYGTLNFSSGEKREDPFSDHEKEYVQLLGKWVGALIERRNTKSNLDKTLNELSDYKRALDESAKVEITDRDGHFIYANDKFCEISGYSRDELIGNGYELINSGYHPDSFFKEMWHTISKGKVWKGEIRNKSQNGKYYWVDTTIIPFLDQDHKPYQYIAVNRDITFKKKAQNALKESEQRFRSVFENAAVGIALVNKNGTIIRCNPALEYMLGYDAMELKKHKIAEVTYPPDLNKDLKLYFELMEGEREMYQIEKRYVKKNGDLIWGRLSVSVIRDEDGSDPYAIGLVEDITSQKKTEMALRDSEKQYRDLFENAVEGIYQSAKDGRLLAANPSMAQILGYASPDELLNTVQNLGREVYVDVSDRKRLLSILEKEKEVKNFQTQLFRKDKTKIWISISVRYLKNSVGEEIMEGTLQDITRKKLAEIRLKEAKEMAEDANRAKSEFLANVSHEIRTPMNAVLGFTDILTEMEKDPQKQQYLEAINSSGKNLLNLINDILDLSKIEAGHLKLEYNVVNFNRLLKEITNIFSLKMESKGLGFKFDVDPVVPHGLLLDEIRVRQVLINLIGNAIKFTDEGQISIKVECETKDEEVGNASILVKVTDTGIGIPKDQQEQIFKSFHQQSGQSNRKYGGTGLGLTISRRLIEKMGGKLGLESEVGKGSTFIIHLPDLTIAAMADELDKENYESVNITFNKADVLIVDDVMLNNALISEYLKTTGLHTIEAENGQEAVDLVRKYRPAVVLMDLKMPVMGGEEATRILKSDPSTSKIPIIALTASVIQSKNTIINKGIFDGFLEKPIKKTELVEELTKYLSYEKVSDSLSEIQKKGTRDKSEEINIPEAMIQDKDALIALLEDEIMQEWEQLNESLVISNVQTFADRLSDINTKYKTNLFTGYVNQLKNSADNFDIENLSKYLKEYPDKVHEVKNLLLDDH
ncbi:MAG TPA: PAS domain S-box protein [Balneolales bacterium]|nr:PAS domain S-box protein [Balneolales bacterium]